MMKNKKIILAILFSLQASSGISAELNTKQELMLTIYYEVMFYKNHCENLKEGKNFHELMLKKIGLNLRDSELAGGGRAATLFKTVDSRMRSFYSKVRDKRLFCVAGIVLYGPNAKHYDTKYLLEEEINPLRRMKWEAYK